MAIVTLILPVLLFLPVLLIVQEVLAVKTALRLNRFWGGGRLSLLGWLLLFCALAIVPGLGDSEWARWQKGDIEKM